jgi:hypothetical protein
VRDDHAVAVDVGKRYDQQIALMFTQPRFRQATGRVLSTATMLTRQFRACNHPRAVIDAREFVGKQRRDFTGCPVNRADMKRWMTRGRGTIRFLCPWWHNF